MIFNFYISTLNSQKLGSQMWTKILKTMCKRWLISFFPPSTGELFTFAVLDREKVVEYTLAVKATDGGGRSCQADIVLLIQDMNDNPPRFSSSHYEVTVFDNTTVRTPVAVIFAKDPDTGERYFYR